MTLLIILHIKVFFFMQFFYVFSFFSFWQRVALRSIPTAAVPGTVAMATATLVESNI